jgi:hypothetical protein
VLYKFRYVVGCLAIEIVLPPVWPEPFALDSKKNFKNTHRASFSNIGCRVPIEHVFAKGIL